jgi:hypothetical protein
MTAVNSLIALVVCSVVGAFTGLMLGGLVGDLFLAMIAGLLATIIAGILRNYKLSQLTVIYDALAIEGGIPLRLIIYSAIATLVGGIAAVGVTTMSGINWSTLLGALSGLFAGTLMLILMSRGEGPAH